MCIAYNLVGENLHRITISTIHETIDTPESSDALYTLSLGQFFNGILGFLGVRDWIQINLNSGESYDFNLTCSPSGDGTLSDPFIRILDLDGNLLEFNGNCPKYHC